MKAEASINPLANQPTYLNFLTPPLTIVSGSSHSGKTATLLEVIKEWVEIAKSGPTKEEVSKSKDYSLVVPFITVVSHSNDSDFFKGIDALVPAELTWLVRKSIASKELFETDVKALSQKTGIRSNHVFVDVDGYTFPSEAPGWYTNFRRWFSAPLFITSLELTEKPIEDKRVSLVYPPF